MIRAFVAIDLPANVRAALTAAQAGLKAARPGVKVAWTKIENLHLTLQFVGQIPETHLAGLSAALIPVASRHGVFDVTVAGVGAFPKVARPRVLWVGCDDVDGKLKALANDVREATAAVGVKPDAHEFTAHLTLGRIKVPRADAALTRALDSLKSNAFGTLRVEAIHFFRSQLQPAGSVYSKLSSHPLGEHHHVRQS